MKVFILKPYPENKPEEGEYFVFMKSPYSEEVFIRDDNFSNGDFNLNRISGATQVTHYLIEEDRVVLTEKEFEEKQREAFEAGRTINLDDQSLKSFEAANEMILKHKDFEDYFKDIKI